MKILKTEAFAETQFLNLNISTYENDKGEMGNWVWAQRTKKQDAVVIAAISDAKLLVIKEFRVPIGGYEWALPAGLIDPGEDPKTTVERELFEETGMSVDSWMRPLSPPIYSCAGLTDEAVYMAYINAKGTLTNRFTEKSEDITPYLLSQDEVKRLLEDKTAKFGAKAYIIMHTFANHGII